MDREVFICLLCPNDKSDKGGCIISNCLHRLCDRCLVNHIINDSVDHKTVKCPVEKCKTQISKREIQKMLGDDFYRIAAMIYKDDAEQVLAVEQNNSQMFVETPQSAFVAYRPEVMTVLSEQKKLLNVKCSAGGFARQQN